MHDNYIFNFLRNLHTVFHSSYIILHSHQQCKNILISPHLHQYLLLSVFFIIVTLASAKGHSVVVLTCSSLMTRDGKHPFLQLLAIHVSSLKKCLLNSLPIFKLGYLSFYCWITHKYLYHICDLKIFPPILWNVFSLSGLCPLKYKHLYFWWIPTYLCHLNNLPASDIKL